MQLIVSCRERLRGRYRESGLERILSAVEAYRDALAQGGFDSEMVFLDGHETLGLIGRGGQRIKDWTVAVKATRAIAKRFEVGGGRAVGITILGGPAILPFARLANPVRDRGIDPDPWIYSDSPYGADHDTLGSYLQTVRPVGRIPDPGTRNVESFLELLRLQTRNWIDSPRREGSCVVFNREWTDSAQRVGRLLPAEVSWNCCPDYRLTTETATDLSKRYLYFNLHGFSNKSGWMGYSESQARFVPAVSPDVLQREDIAGSIIFCENCYGAAIEGKKPTQSCALRAMTEGAAVFVGATGLAFGSHLPPEELEYADELAERFLAYHTAGEPAGSSLQRARSDYFGRALADGVLDPFEKKTALQFVLLGDPLQ